MADQVIFHFAAVLVMAGGIVFIAESLKPKAIALIVEGLKLFIIPKKNASVKRRRH